MRLLRDRDLYDEISRGRIVVDGLPDGDLTYDRRHSLIQACSLDLSIGDIFYPTISAEADDDRAIDEHCISEAGDGVGPHKPVDEHILRPGKTAHIRTREVLDIPADIAGIAFPPSELASKGILTTNPGHLDPGYHGRLHLTIINMGRSCQPLQRGQRIITVLFFALPDVCEFPYSARIGKQRQQNKTPGEGAAANEGKVEVGSADEQMQIETTVGKLAPDFMNFRRHAKAIADQIASEKVKTIDRNLSQWQGYGKMATALATIAIIGLGTLGQCRYSALEERIRSLDTQMEVTGRLAIIEEDLARIKGPLSALGNGDSEGTAPRPGELSPQEELK